MGIFDWFGKKEVVVAEEIVVADTVSQYEFNVAYNELSILLQELTAVVYDNKVITDRIKIIKKLKIAISNTSIMLLSILQYRL